MSKKNDENMEIPPVELERMKEEVMREREGQMQGTSTTEEWVAPSPYNALEYNNSITVPSWGDYDYYSPDARSKLNRNSGYIEDKNTDTVTQKEAPQPILQYLQIVLKKDLRLGNLSELTGEINYCKEHLDFSYDCIDAEYPESSQVCIERAASMVELSHSKGGFFRKLIHTITKRDYKEIREPGQKGLFGKPREEDGGQFQ